MRSTNGTSVPEPITLADPQLYAATHYALAALYGVLVVSTVAIVIVKLHRGTLKEAWKLCFFAFVVSGSLLRGAWALLCPFELYETVNISNRLDFYLNLSPSFLFFSNYLILLFVWAELYHFHSMSIVKLRVHLSVTLGLMYAVVLVLFIVDVADNATQPARVSR